MDIVELEPMNQKPIELASGEMTRDIRLDCTTQVDLNSLKYPASDIPKIKDNMDWSVFGSEVVWPLHIYLDQGQEGACVSAGWGHELAAQPYGVSGVTMQKCREKIYFPAQKIDEWEGGAYPGAQPFYEGTSVLAGAKVVKELGLICSYYWAMDILQLAAALWCHGPAVIGVNWYEGMTNPDKRDGKISPTGKIVGKHCVCVTGMAVARDHDTNDPDFLNSYFIIHNSWGHKWGAGGRARISFADMVKLFPGGDFCIPFDRKSGWL